VENKPASSFVVSLWARH